MTSPVLEEMENNVLTKLVIRGNKQNVTKSQTLPFVITYEALK